MDDPIGTRTRGQEDGEDKRTGTGRQGDGTAEQGEGGQELKERERKRAGGKLVAQLAGEAGNRSAGNSGMRGEGRAARRQGEGGARVLTHVKREPKSLSRHRC